MSTVRRTLPSAADHDVLDVVEPLRQGVDHRVHLAGVGSTFGCAVNAPGSVPKKSLRPTVSSS